MGKYRLDQVMLAAILLQLALPPLTADAQSTQNDLGSAIALQDADIDAISDVPTLRRLLKRYSGLVRSGAGIQEQQAARQREEFALQTRALEAQALSYGNFALYLMDVNSGDESAAEKLSEAQEECRNLSTLQSAVNGGLARLRLPYSLPI